MRGQSRRLLKGLLSAFAIFHVLSVFVLPNPESILYRELTPIIKYGNLLGLNTTWRFFSPNPGIRRVEYEVFIRDAQGELKSEIHQFPELDDRKQSVEVYNRKLYHEMFLMGKGEPIARVFGPYLCRQHPEAEQIALYWKGRKFDTLEKSRFQGDERNEIGEIERNYATDIYCE